MDVDTSQGFPDPGAAPQPLALMDAGSRGLRDFEGDPIGLCTESLGFESSTEEAAAVESIEEEMRPRWRTEEIRASRWRLVERGFPPPLTWLVAGGRRSVFMRSEREGGRLRISEVRVERPGVFLASREAGRLRLFRISEWDRGSEEAEMSRRSDPDPEEEGEGEGEEKRGEWERGRRGEGLRRCQEAVSGDRISVLWCNNHRYMTTA
ncbi:hypothetical protein J5N97_017640 [Dioscorea zingiberensis]|uniref:FAF domain-containing protein n=1 Tax=Dioscorea zingiberensis TaxID=325984 RepID=A0A9D5HGK4_9LILI|nr:hypothetical protein J5N97_017640 [Dioscorea zingiberensis]